MYNLQCPACREKFATPDDVPHVSYPDVPDECIRHLRACGVLDRYSCVCGRAFDQWDALWNHFSSINWPAHVTLATLKEMP